MRTTRTSVLIGMKQRILSIVALIALMLGFTACDDHEDSKPYIDIISVTSCSPDLLEFVTPTVTITAENGETQSQTLSPSDFKESEEGSSININVSINGYETTSSSTTVNYIAKYIKRFNTESISGKIEVSYTLNDKVEMNKDSYVFFHGVGYDSTCHDKDGINITTNGSYMKPVAYKIQKEDVDKYLKELISSSDEISFKVSVSNKK